MNLFRTICILVLLFPTTMFSQSQEELIEYLDQGERYTFNEYSEFARDIIHQIKSDAYGYIWIGTSGSGVYRYDGYNLENYSPQVGDSGNYPGRNCKKITVLKDNSIWFSYEGGICKFDYRTKKFNSRVKGTEGFNDFEVSVLNILDLDEKHLLVCTKMGFWIFDKNEFRIKERFLVSESWNPDFVITGGVKIPNENKVILCALNGYYIFDTQTEKIDTIPFNNSNILRQEQISHTNPILYKDNIVYSLGSYNTQIISHDLGTGKAFSTPTRIIQSERGSYKSLISDLSFLNDSIIIFNSEDGFSTFNINSKEIKNLNHKRLNGIGPFYFDDNGTLWFYTYWKLNKFDAPTYAKKNSISPLLSIANIKINGKNEETTRYINDFELKEYEKNLRFNISLINPIDTNSISYEYQLLGSSPSWKSIPSHFIELSDLPGGKYTLNVRALLNNQLIVEQKMIDFKKEKTIYEHWWFWLFSVLTLGLLVYLFNYFRIQSVRKEERLKAKYEKKLGELQMEALQSQMNPHFIFNALNSIKHFILTNEKFKASEYLSSFSNLVRQVLNNSKLSKISMTKEIETLKLYIEMEKMRFDQKFDFSIYVDPNIDQFDIEFPPMIFQPYVENAIWHGLMHKADAGQLSLRFEKENGHLFCSIEDNGIGRERAMEVKSKNATYQKSFGMQITKERMDFSQLNAKVKIIDLKDHDDRPIGTRVEIRIPLQTLE